jgi:hypothetical protein
MRAAAHRSRRLGLHVNPNRIRSPGGGIAAGARLHPPINLPLT